MSNPLADFYVRNDISTIKRDEAINDLFESVKYTDPELLDVDPLGPLLEWDHYRREFYIPDPLVVVLAELLDKRLPPADDEGRIPFPPDYERVLWSWLDGAPDRYHKSQRKAGQLPLPLRASR